MKNARPGMLVGSLQHRKMKGKQNNCNLFSCLQEEEEVVERGGLPRVPK